MPPRCKRKGQSIDFYFLGDAFTAAQETSGKLQVSPTSAPCFLNAPGALRVPLAWMAGYKACMQFATNSFARGWSLAALVQRDCGGRVFAHGRAGAADTLLCLRSFGTRPAACSQGAAAPAAAASAAQWPRACSWPAAWPLRSTATAACGRGAGAPRARLQQGAALELPRAYWAGAARGLPPCAAPPCAHARGSAAAASGFAASSSHWRLAATGAAASASSGSALRAGASAQSGCRGRRAVSAAARTPCCLSKSAAARAEALAPAGPSGGCASRAWPSALAASARRGFAAHAGRGAAADGGRGGSAAARRRGGHGAKRSADQVPP